MSANQRPAYELRFGLIKATVWRKQTKSGTRHHVKLVRLFKDGDTWRESNQFGRDDLPLVGKLADHCHTWIYTHSQDDAPSAEKE